MNLIPALFVATSTLLSAHFGTLAPVMTQIAQCESSQRQFDEFGEPLMSSTSDYGFFQINEKVWDAEASRRNLDYKHSLVDNVKMAKIVLRKQGLTAWACYAKIKPLTE